MTSKPPDNTPILAVSGEARRSQQIIELGDRDTRSDRREIRQLFDYYAKTGTYLIEALLASAVAHLKAEFPERPCPYFLRGPDACRDHQTSQLPSLPSDKVLIRAVRENNDVHDEKDELFRIHEFLGFREARQETPSLPSTSNNTSHQRLEASDRPSTFVHVVAIDFEQFGSDADFFSQLGIAHAAKGHLNALMHNRDAFFVIKCRNVRGWKDSRPATIRDNLSGFLQAPALNTAHIGDASLLIVSGEELRSYHLPISHQVSWERTIQSTLAILKHAVSDNHHIYHFLAHARHIVLTFGCDGALYVVQEHGKLLFAYCIIDPSITEGDIVRKYGPRMHGFDSLTTAAIAHSLMKRTKDGVRLYPGENGYHLAVNEGIIRGLKAARLLQIHGFTYVRRDDRSSMESSRNASDTAQMLDCFKDGSEHSRFNPVAFSKGWLDDISSDNQAQFEFGLSMPFELLGCVIASGSPDWRTWFPFDPDVSNTQQGTGALRRLGNRLKNEWRACGWFHSHFFDDHDIRHILRGKPSQHGRQVSESSKERGPAEQQPYFDYGWWSFVADFFVARELLPESDPDKTPSADIIARILAHKILRFDTDWLSSDHRSNQRRLKAFFNYVLNRLWNCPHEEFSAEVKLGLSRKLQIDICDNLRRRLSFLLGEPFDSKSVENPLDVLVDHLITRQKEHPELPTLMGTVPYASVGKVKTVDRREMESLRNLSMIIRNYLDARPRTPLNLGVFGPPGAGKSFFIEQIFQSLHDVSRDGLQGGMQPMTFNLSQFANVDLLTQAFEEIQDLGLRGNIPLIFWDEYDTPLDRQPLGWLSYFLGPMNDGVYFQRERTRRLPPAIFVFAGSMFTSFMSMEMLDYYAALGENKTVNNYSVEQWRAAKGPDFKSRLSGIMDVLGVNESPKVEVHTPHAAGDFPGDRRTFDSLPTDRFGYYVRRAVILRGELWRQHKRLFNEDKILQISPKVAEAFIEISKYLHGSRSIRQIVQMSSVGERLAFDTSCLPAASQLRLHVDPKEFETWFKEIDPRRPSPAGLPPPPSPPPSSQPPPSTPYPSRPSR